METVFQHGKTRLICEKLVCCIVRAVEREAQHEETVASPSSAMPTACLIGGDGSVEVDKEGEADTGILLLLDNKSDAISPRAMRNVVIWRNGEVFFRRWPVP